MPELLSRGARQPPHRAGPVPPTKRALYSWLLPSAQAASLAAFPSTLAVRVRVLCLASYMRWPTP